MDLASVRILRLALGTALSLWFSQAIGWPLSFIAPVLTSVVLAMPMPAFPLKAAVGLVMILMIALNVGTWLLPTLINQPAAGIVLLGLALYWSFYVPAKGGPAALGTFATIGLALTVAVGSVNIDAVLALIGYTGMAAAAGVSFVWLAHRLLPDSMAEPRPRPTPAPTPSKPDPAAARWSALRSLLIVFPVVIWLLFSGDSAAHVAVMIKTAAMGQQASNKNTLQAGRSLLLATAIGGIGAVIGWQVLSIAPTLAIYVLIVAIAALVIGSRVFDGAGLGRDAETWSYALLTMLIILAPAVMDGLGGANAGAKFVDRLLMFVWATLYAVSAVFVVDALRPRAAADPSADLSREQLAEDVQ